MLINVQDLQRQANIAREADQKVLCNRFGDLEANQSQLAEMLGNSFFMLARSSTYKL